MKTLSFPTIKLGEHIKQIKLKVKDTEFEQSDLTVYGVTNTEGVSITNNKSSDDLGNYIVLNERQFAYNPYRINVGSIGLTTTGTVGVVSPAYIVFETDEQIDDEFLLYYLKSSIGINLIKWYGDRGGVRAALRYSDLEKIDFPDISLEKQLFVLSKIKQIESKLECFVGQITNKTVENLRQSILQQAIEGKLCEQNPDDEPASVFLEKIKKEKDRLIEEGKIKKLKNLPPISDEEKPFGIPDGWEWCRFGEIANIASNLVAPDNYMDYMHIAPDNIEKHTARLLTCYTVQENNIKSFNHFFSEGQIIYSKIRPALRKVVLAPFNGLCSADMYPIDALCVPKYLLYYMLTDDFTVQVTMNDNRVKMPKTNQQELLKVLVPMPPLQEQQRIVEKVNKLMTLCNELEKEIDKAQKYASQLMESVLQEAFSIGERTTKEQSRQKRKVITIRPERKEELHFAAAARGNIKQSTMESLQKRAIEIANGEK